MLPGSRRKRHRARYRPLAQRLTDSLVYRLPVLLENGYDERAGRRVAQAPLVDNSVLHAILDNMPKQALSIGVHTRAQSACIHAGRVAGAARACAEAQANIGYDILRLFAQRPAQL